MVGFQSDRSLHVGLPLFQRLAGHAEDQIERYISNPPPYPLARLADSASIMIALQQSQDVGLKGLHAKADAIDAVVGEDGDFRVIDGNGIRFQRELIIGSERESIMDHDQQAAQLAGRQLRRSSAADENRFHWVRRARWRKPREDTSHLPFQCIQILVRERIPAGDHSEIAIAAVMSAKRDVNVHSPRLPPTRRRFQKPGFSEKPGFLIRLLDRCSHGL